MKVRNGFRKAALYVLAPMIMSSCSVLNKSPSYEKYTYEKGLELGMKKLSMVYGGNAYFNGETFEVLLGRDYVEEDSFEDVLKIADSNPKGKRDKHITLDDYHYALNRIKK